MGTPVVRPDDTSERVWCHCIQYNFDKAKVEGYVSYDTTEMAERRSASHHARKDKVHPEGLSTMSL